jgi:hypothetical protein
MESFEYSIHTFPMEIAPKDGPPIFAFIDPNRSDGEGEFDIARYGETVDGQQSGWFELDWSDLIYEESDEAYIGWRPMPEYVRKAIDT